MANHLVEGKLGTGKGKFTVNKMQQALRNGCRVATNIDLVMEHLMASNNKMSATRLPDKPTAIDLMDIGPGCADEDRYDEEKYGVMVLDELATWLNARTHNDSERQAFIDFCVHARKHRWHVYFICQNINMIDRQVREGLVEYLVKMVRGDKIRIPVVGALLGKLGKLKGLHIANTSLVDMPGFVVDRDWFRGKDLHKAYDTLQIFRKWERNPTDAGFAAETFMGPYSYLSAWHLKGRHETAQEARQTMLQAWLHGPARPRPQLKPKTRLVSLLSTLPPDQAWRYAQRLARLEGAA